MRDDTRSRQPGASTGRRSRARKWTRRHDARRTGVAVIQFYKGLTNECFGRVVFLAAPQGFEPRYDAPEASVLPLNEGAATTFHINERIPKGQTRFMNTHPVPGYLLPYFQFV